MAPPLITSVANVQADTGGGTQDITFDLGGLTPWFFAIVAYRTELDEAGATTGTGTNMQQSASSSWGCTDGTNEWVNAIAAEDNVAVVDSYDWFRSDLVVLVLDPADGTSDGDASFTSFSANTVRITWGTTPPSAWEMVAIAFAGGGGSAEVGTATSNATSGSSVDVTHSLGVAPRGLIFTGGGDHTVVDTGSANNSGRFVLGYGSWDSATIRQTSHGISIGDTIALGNSIGAYLHTSRILSPPSYLVTDPVGGQPHLEVTAVTSTEVEVTTRISSHSMDFGYALLAGVECFAGIWDLPTGTGSKTFDMPAGPNDIRPQAGFFTHTRMLTTDADATSTNNVRIGTWGWGLAGSALNTGTGCLTFQRNTYPTQAGTVVDQTALWRNYQHDQGIPAIHADLTSWDTDGLTVDSRTSNANIIEIPMLLVGAIRISPTGLDVGIDFGSPSLSLLLAPSGLAVPIAFGPPTLSLVLAPTGLSVPIAFGSPSLTLVLAPDGLPVAIAFGGPSLTLVLAPEGLAIPIVFGGPSLSLVLAPDGLEVPIVFGEPSFALTQLLAPTGLAVPIVFGSPTLTLVISPTGLAVAIAFGAPSLTLVLAPDGLSVLIQFGSVMIGTGAFVASWPAGQVVQGGPVAGMVTQSGTVMGQVVQGGPVAGQVIQGGAVVGQVVQGGSVAGQVGQGA